MGKFLLNLVYGEPLALVKDLAFFDNSIWLYLLLESVLDIFLHDLISFGLLDATLGELCLCQFPSDVIFVQQWRKVLSELIHIEYWVKTKQWWNVDLKGIVPYSLGDHA